MLPLVLPFFAHGANAGIWETAMSILNTAPQSNMNTISDKKLAFEPKNGTETVFIHQNLTEVLCREFDFLDMEFTPLELADPDEYFFLSDNAEYVVTRLETSWLLHNVIDDELLMFGLSGTCPGDAKWYWINTMERVGDETADFEPEMTAEIVKQFETRPTVVINTPKTTQQSYGDLSTDLNDQGHQSTTYSNKKESRLRKSREEKLSKKKIRSEKLGKTVDNELNVPETLATMVLSGGGNCKKEQIGETVTVKDYILNDFDNGIIFNFYEESNVEINVVFPLNLSVGKLKGNISVKDQDGQTNIVILNQGEIRSLVVLDLNESEKKMVQSGLVLKLGTICIN